MRLEIKPFGVDVLSIVSGVVKTNGHSYYEKWELPPGSLYKPIEATIKMRAQGNDGIPRMNLDEYSVAVTDEIIKRTPGKVWLGNMADVAKATATNTAISQGDIVSWPQRSNPE